LKDVIDQELSIGDYVTGIWANAELELFEIVDLQENGKFTSNSRIKRGAVVVLKRLFNSDVSEDRQNKPVKKLNSQVTKVPEQAVRDYVMMYKLEN
jgi:hypothetical protein